MSTMIFDDTNLFYTGKWTIGGTSSEYHSTTHGTNEAGASASFSFNGTSISVYGTIAANAKRAVSTYSVDGSPAVAFTAHPTKFVQYKQLFYQISHLSYGRHHLVINNTNDGAQFWLDFLEVGIKIGNIRASTTSSTLIPSTELVTESSSNVPITASSTSSTSRSSSRSIITLPSSTVTSSAGFSASVATSTPMLTTNITTSPSMVPLVAPSSSASFGNYAPPKSSTQATSALSGNHAGVIAGGVIATLVCIALAVAAFLWVRWRRAMRAPSRQAPKIPDPNWFKGIPFNGPKRRTTPVSLEDSICADKLVVLHDEFGQCNGL